MYLYRDNYAIILAHQLLQQNLQLLSGQLKTKMLFIWQLTPSTIIFRKTRQSWLCFTLHVSASFVCKCYINSPVFCKIGFQKSFIEKLSSKKASHFLKKTLARVLFSFSSIFFIGLSRVCFFCKVFHLGKFKKFSNAQAPVIVINFGPLLAISANVYFEKIFVRNKMFKIFLLTHFMPLISFDTPWKHQKTSGSKESNQRKPFQTVL